MENIFFAVITIGLLCLDSSLTREMINKIKEEIAEYKRNLTAVNSMGKDRVNAIIDNVTLAVNVLQCQENKIGGPKQKFIIITSLVILSLNIIIIVLINWACENFQNSMVIKMHKTYVIIGNLIWVILLTYYFFHLVSVIRVYRQITFFRNKLEQLMLDLGLIDGLP